MNKKGKAFKILCIITLFLIGIPFLISAGYQGYKVVSLVVNVINSNVTFSFMAIFYVGIEFLLSLSIVFFAIQGLVFAFKGEPNNRLFNALARSFTNISTVLLISILFTFLDKLKSNSGTSLIILISLFVLLFLSDLFIGIVTFTFYKDCVKPKKVLTILSALCLIPPVAMGLWANFDVCDIAVYYNSISILLISIFMIITACLYDYHKPSLQDAVINQGNINYAKNENKKRKENILLTTNMASEPLKDDIKVPESEVIKTINEEPSDFSFDIPQDLKEIKDHQFAKNGTLLQVSIPNGITSLGPGCFANCYNIKKLYIPHSVTLIGFNAFFNCLKLNEIYYDGTKQEFKQIKRGSNWLLKAGTDIICCKDGKIKITIKNQ